MFLSKNANRKQKRKFNKEYAKLPKETQYEVLQAELLDKLSPSMNKAITEAMISGMNLAFEQLYEDFVIHIDEAINSGDSDKELAIYDNLLSAIRKRYIEIQANKAREGKSK